MIAPLLRGIALLVTTFSLAMGAMHAPRYDDGGLRANLSTPDCRLPCFLGIRPGVTPWDEAAALLEANPWVERVDARENFPRITWTWNGEQPAFLPGGATRNSMSIRGGIVTQIDLLTGENLATFLLVFGLPDAWFSSTWSILEPQSNIWHTNLTQSITYQAERMEVMAPGTCPLSLNRQWALATQISLLAEPDQVGYSRYDDRTPLVLIGLRETCR